MVDLNDVKLQHQYATIGLDICHTRKDLEKVLATIILCTQYIYIKLKNNNVIMNLQMNCCTPQSCYSNIDTILDQNYQLTHRVLKWVKLTPKCLQQLIYPQWIVLQSLAMSKIIDYASLHLWQLSKEELSMLTSSFQQSYCTSIKVEVFDSTSGSVSAQGIIWGAAHYTLSA